MAKYGTGYSLATISAGSNITVTNTAGGISIGATTPSNGADTGLTNLASVAINASLVPGAGGMALGSATKPYNSLYTGVSGSGAGLNSLATVARTVTFQDAAGTICMQASTACNFATQTDSNYYIQSQAAAVQTASSLWLSGTGRADTAVVTSTIDRQAAANLLVGNTNATAINVGNAASNITLDGGVIAGGSSITIGTVGSTQIVNNGAVINTVKVLGNYATGGVIGTAATTVDVYSAYTVAQTTGGQALSLPTPANTAAGRVVYVSNIGSAAFSISGTTIGSGSSEVYIWNGTTWVPAPAGATTVTTVGATLNPSTFSFAGKVDYGVGTNPTDIVTADVNGDGKSDILTSNNTTSTVSVLINNGNGTFATKVDYATATGPWGICSADVNGDGKPDIVSANYTANTISVLINNGNGTFAAKVDYTTGTQPYDIISADVNGDSNPDIIVTNRSSNTASVFINNGNGTFAAKVDYSTGTGPFGVTSVDVNGDGNPDVLVANNTSNTASVLINNGNGTFAAKVDYVTGTNPSGITAVDVNGDNLLDIVTANNGAATVSVLLNNGNGTFAAKVDYATGTGPRFVSSSDVNIDGRPDMITINAISNSVSVFINNTATMLSPNGAVITGSTIQLQQAGVGFAGVVTTGTQFFQGQKTFASTLTASAGSTLQGGVASLNDSSNFDTNINTGGSTGAVTIGGGNVVVHNTNDSTTAFAVKTSTDATVLGVDTTHQGVSIGDQATYVDGGSNTIYAALSTTMTDPAKAGLILQAASGQAVDILRVQDSTTAALFNVNRLGFVGIGVDIPTQQLDVNGDMNIAGQLDAMGQVHIDNAGNFLNVRDLTVTGNASLIKPTVDSADAFKVQDASGATLLQVDSLTSNLTVGVANDSSQFINNGSTQNTTLELTDFPTGGSIGSAATTVDVYTNINIAQTTASQTLTIPNPTSASAGRTIYITNTGSTTFTLLGSPIPQNTSANLQWDGTTWILASTGVQGVSAVGGVSLNPSFAAKVDYSTGTGPNVVSSADVNGDAKPDIMVTNYSSNTVSVLINNGNGTFAAKVDYVTGTNPAGIATADVNGDGKPDIITANNSASTISVLLNNGNGTFAAKVDYATNSGTAILSAADVNSDGKLDIIVSNWSSNTVSVLINNGNGTFAAKVDYSVTSPYGITSTDLNSDSKPDIIVNSYTTNTVSVLINNGNGTFAAKVDYPTGIGSFRVTTADVNGDTKPDIITANNNSSTVSVLINNGNGTFAAKVDYVTGTNPNSIISADVNTDGKPDIIVSNSSSNTASVLINNGNGTFAAKVDYATGTSPGGVTTADVNGDGKPDILFANNSSNTVSVFLNTFLNLSADGMSISSNIANFGEVTCTNPGLFTIVAQCIQGQKTFAGTLTASAGSTLQGGVASLNDSSNFDTNINTGGSTGAVTIGGGNLVVHNTNDSTTAFAVKTSTDATVLGVDTTHQGVSIGDQATYVDGSSNTIYAALSTTMTDPAKAGLILQAASGQAVDILRVQDSTTAALFNVNRLGFVGIGVDIPTQQLDVNGDMNIGGQLDAMGQVHIDNAGNFLNVRDLTVTGNASLIKPTLDSADAFKVQDASGATLLQVDTLTSNLTVGVANDSSQFINNGSTQNATLELTDFPTGGSIGTAVQTVDVYTNINIAQTTASQTLTIPNPTSASAGRTIYITNTGSTTFTLLGSPIPQNTGANLLWDGTTWILASTGVQGVSAVGGIVVPNSASFATKVDYAATNGTYGTASGDVNGDGQQDIIATNYTSSTVSVFINNGNGTFAAKVDYTTGTGPYGVSVADVNNDSWQDIVVSNYTAGGVSVLINNGNGTFAAKVDYATGTATYTVSVNDFDADGYKDIVSVNYLSNTASVLINNGNGTFATKVDYATGSAPISVSSVDVDNDTKPDIVVTNRTSNTVSVFINNGNGTFATKVDYTTGTNPYGVTHADVNGDGKADIVTSNYGSNTASVFINNGNGTFATKVDYTTGTNPYSVTTADVNGDGVIDILVANNGSNTASVFINNGNGTFGTKLDFATASGPRSITTADVNGDAKPDVITANYTANNVSVLANTSLLSSHDSSIISANSLRLQQSGVVFEGIVSTGTQFFQGSKSLTGLLTASAGISVSGDTVNINDSSNFDVNINTGTSTGVVTVGGSAAVFKPSSDSATSFSIQNSTNGSLLNVDSTNMVVTVQAITVSGSLTVNGHIIGGNASAPSPAAGAAACTSPTVTLSGTDMSGTLSITTGTGCGATGTLATVSFVTAYGVAPKVVKLTPSNSNAADLQYYTGTRAVGSFTVDTATAPVDATEYLYNYLVAQ